MARNKARRMRLTLPWRVRSMMLILVIREAVAYAPNGLYVARIVPVSFQLGSEFVDVSVDSIMSKRFTIVRYLVNLSRRMQSVSN